MPLKAYWAYDFAFDRPIEEMLAVFNEAGSWQWGLRDSAWYGDYLNTRPLEGVRVRVHQYPQEPRPGVLFIGLQDKGFSALLQIEAESTATQAQVEDGFRRLLTRINATNVTQIEPYD